MKIRCIIGSAAFAASLTCSGAWAWDQDPAAQYFERKDTIVSGAGDARDVNAATHIIDPWPRYVGNRRIPGNGDRIVAGGRTLPPGIVQAASAADLHRSGPSGSGIGGGAGGGVRVVAAWAAAGGRRRWRRLAGRWGAVAADAEVAARPDTAGFDLLRDESNRVRTGCRNAFDFKFSSWADCWEFGNITVSGLTTTIPARISRRVAQNAQPSGLMQIYFFTAGTESSELNELESRIRSTVPSLRKLANLDAVIGARGQDGASVNHDQIYIIFPVLTGTSFDRMANIAEQEHRGIFFIFVSSEISASDYKRLVRSGGADWVSIQGAPQEIARHHFSHRSGRKSDPATLNRFDLPSWHSCRAAAGSATPRLRSKPPCRSRAPSKRAARRVCLLDLDLQASHICDYLDIEPRFHIEEIIQNPDRLDAQLFDLFVSRHAASGIDVLAAPRNRRASVELNMAALDALFRFISAAI